MQSLDAFTLHTLFNLPTLPTLHTVFTIRVLRALRAHCTGKPADHQKSGCILGASLSKQLESLAIQASVGTSVSPDTADHYQKINTDQRIDNINLIILHLLNFFSQKLRKSYENIV